MNTTELNGTEYTLTEGEGGKITLTPLNKQPEKRTPEAGDVWKDEGGFANFISRGGQVVDLKNGYISLKKYNQYGIHYSATYLGKFDEVYVNRAEFISDVRAALSHKDSFGGCILRPLPGCGLGVSGLEQSRAALRKLNIITD